MNLNQITISCTNLENSINFYQILGLTLIVSSPPQYARFECPEGDTTFSLHTTPGPILANGTAVYFECQNLDDHVAYLINQGIAFDHLPIDTPWLWREAKLKDPDGNQLILFYAGQYRKDPPWRLEKTI